MLHVRRALLLTVTYVALTSKQVFVGVLAKSWDLSRVRVGYRCFFPWRSCPRRGNGELSEQLGPPTQPPQPRTAQRFTHLQ
jgi:hypothetical protein